MVYHVSPKQTSAAKEFEIQERHFLCQLDMEEYDGMIEDVPEGVSFVFLCESEKRETHVEPAAEEDQQHSKVTKSPPEAATLTSERDKKFMIQSVHVPVLAQLLKSKLVTTTEQQIIVKSGRSGEEYYKWWLQQQHDSKMFAAQLIGDADAPHKFAAMTFSDLSFYW